MKFKIRDTRDPEFGDEGTRYTFVNLSKKWNLDSDFLAPPTDDVETQHVVPQVEQAHQALGEVYRDRLQSVN